SSAFNKFYGDHFCWLSKNLYVSLIVVVTIKSYWPPKVKPNTSYHGSSKLTQPSVFQR
ncbi:18248_t:CDS:1, partial [Funneliformis geosporum]